MRLIDQRTGNRHALLLSARELRRLVVQALGQADFPQQFGGVLSHLALRNVFHVSQGHHDVLQGARAWEEIEGLEDKADHPFPHPGSLPGRQPGNVFAVQPVFASGGMIEAAQDVHQGALAGTAGAHQCYQLSRRDAQRNAVEHWQVHLAQVVCLTNVSKFN